MLERVKTMRFSSSVDGVTTTLDVVLTPQGLRVTETRVKPGAELEEVRRGLIEARGDVSIVHLTDRESIVVHLRLCDKDGGSGDGADTGFKPDSIIEEHHVSVVDPALAEPLAKVLALFFDERTVIVANDDGNRLFSLVA